MKEITTEFDDVVYSTDPDLRRRYEKQAGMKHGLPFVLEEYRKLAASTPWRLYPREMIRICLLALALVLAFVGVIMSIYIGSGAVENHGWFGITLVGLVGLLIAMLAVFSCYESKDSQRRSAMNERYEVLKNFADAVGYKITPQKDHASQHWTRISSIEPSLVQIGQDIIWAELRFDALCQIGRSRRDDIVIAGAKLQSLDRDLAQGLHRAEWFGLKLARAEVLVKAKKVLGHAK
jgi:hypothetical protein